MNAMISQYEEQDFDCQSTFRREGNSQRSADFGGGGKQPRAGRRRGKTPQKFNGIHRRRRKKTNW